MSPLGAVMLSFGFYAALVLVSGWMGVVGFVLLVFFRMFFWLMFEVPAVGLMILTRFGTRGGGGDAIFVPAVPQPGPAVQSPAPPEAPFAGEPPAPAGGVDTAEEPRD